MPSELDFGWAVGLYEGEGTVAWVENKSGYGHMEFKINQAGSPEILDRFRDIVGFGLVAGPYGPYANSNHQPQWHFYTHNVSDIRMFMDIARDNLSSRRVSQYERVLNKMTKYKIQKAEFCRRGVHDKTAPGRCKECRKNSRSARKEKYNV